MEVEHRDHRAIPNVVVAQIKENVQHRMLTGSASPVDDGSGTARQIVCGAKNYKVGDKVPLALPGAQLAPDFTIKVGKLRGVESQGMLCSAKELNLAEDAEGLLILPPDAKVGAPIGELFPGDTVLDLEITPNRPDLLSHYGIAREVAASPEALRRRRSKCRAGSGAEGAQKRLVYPAESMACGRAEPGVAVRRLEAVGCVDQQHRGRDQFRDADSAAAARVRRGKLAVRSRASRGGAIVSRARRKSHARRG